MKYYELDEEEKQLLKDIENGEFVSVKNVKEEIEKAVVAANYTFSKARNINIRLSEKDLLKIKRKAAESGIPYQTLVSSILHRFANN